MSKITTLVVLMAIALAGSALADESERIWSLPDPQAPALTQPSAPEPAPAGSLIQNLQQAQPAPYNAPAWQQPRQWPMQQPWGGQFQPRYPAGSQIQTWQQPQVPASPQTAPAAVANPRDEELKRLREQVIEQEDELNRANEMLANQYAQLNEAYARIEQLRRGEVEVQEARARIEQMRGTEIELQKARSRIEQLRTELDAQSATANEQIDKIDYLTRMQHAVRVQIAEMVDSQRATDTMLEQQQQLISNYETQNRQLTEERKRLRDNLVRLNEKVSALQAEVLRALSDSLTNTPNTP